MDQFNSTKKNFLIIIIVIALAVFAFIYSQKNKIPMLSYEEYLQQGIGLETRGELENAILSYQNASKVSPKSYVPHSNIGSAYFSMKKYPEAETALLKALELDPASVSVYTKLYDVYFIGMRRVTLMGFFKDAIEKTGGNVSIIRLYASYLENIADLESALKIWESLLQVEPDNVLYKAKIEALQKKIEGLE